MNEGMAQVERAYDPSEVAKRAGQQPRDASELDMALSNLRDSLEVQGVNIDNLQHRLQPVLRDNDARADGDTAPSPVDPRSALVRELYRLAGVVQSHTVRLCEMRDRLDT